MAKLKPTIQLEDNFKEVLNKTNLVKVKVEDEMKKSFISYAMAVNVSRAIPDVRDGLKPVHRRILYAMHELGLTYDKGYKKCAKIVGEVLGKYHPHGDSSVYDALVRLAQDFSINFPLVDGQGNFGSVDGDPAAAYRYTEARMSKLANEMLREIDKETVDFYPNFDDTEMQPTVLPSRIPNLLVNGADGIAVGMATNIPPHNLAECVDGIIAQLDNPEITIEELMQYIPAPDFPTGALIMGRSGIRQAYETGRGSFILRAKTEIEEYTQGNNTRTRIVVTELPYQVNKARLIETIADLVKDKRVEGIADIRDESDKDGMRMVIEIKNDANAQVVLNTLFKHTSLQSSNGIILLALVDGEPKVLNLKQILSCYIAHQKEVIIRRTKFDLNKAEERYHIVEGLIKALANIDEVIKVIKASKEKQEAVKNLCETFILSEKQANAILEMRLQRLTALEVDKLQDEMTALENTISNLKAILGSEQMVIDIIKADLIEIKEKYPSERRSELSYDYGDIDIADLIKEEDIVVSMTHEGYIKRIPVDEYRAQRRGGRGVTGHKAKDSDFVEKIFICSTHDDILFFSDKGKVYRTKGYEIPEGQRQARGKAIVNLLILEKDEKINTIISLKEDNEGYLMMATEKGYIKKTALSEFDRIRKTGKIAISLNEGDRLINVQFTSGEDEVLIGTHFGKCIRFSEKDVRPLGRDTQGVKSMDLADGDYLVGMSIVKAGDEILTITTNGYGKRTSETDYRLQNRAGKGVKAGEFNEKTGNLVCLRPVSSDEDVLMITDCGVIIRVNSQEISLISRATQGVKVMRIEDAKITSVALSPRSENEDGEEGEEGENASVTTDTTEGSAE